MPTSEDASEEEERLERLKAQREVIMLLEPSEAAAMLRGMPRMEAGELLALMDEEKRASAMEALSAQERTEIQVAAVPATISNAPGLAPEAPLAEAEATVEPDVPAEARCAPDAITESSAAPAAHADSVDAVASSKPAVDVEANDVPAAASVADERSASEDTAGIATPQMDAAPTEGHSPSAAGTAAIFQPPPRTSTEATEDAETSKPALSSAAAATQVPSSASSGPAALSKPNECEEEDEGDGIVAAWVIGNRRIAQGPAIVPVRTTWGHSSWLDDEISRSYPDQQRYQQFGGGGGNEALLADGSGDRPAAGIASRLKSSVPSKVTEMGGRALDAAGTAAGLARHSLSAAATSSERAMGAAGSAAGAARQSLAQAAPTKVTELSQRAREAASSAADRARHSVAQATATGQRAGEATAAARLSATEAKERAKEKLAGAADVAKSGLAQASQSFVRLARKG